ncbi:MAG UNVERIFIED_CONTAM: hypothetical protein LVR18_50200 [Planctomycetaceae bacterium]
MSGFPLSHSANDNACSVPRVYPVCVCVLPSAGRPSERRNAAAEIHPLNLNGNVSSGSQILPRTADTARTIPRWQPPARADDCTTSSGSATVRDFRTVAPPFNRVQPLLNRDNPCQQHSPVRQLRRPSHLRRRRRNSPRTTISTHGPGSSPQPTSCLSAIVISLNRLDPASAGTRRTAPTVPPAVAHSNAGDIR